MPVRQLTSDEDQVVDIQVLAGIQDPDGDPLTVVSASAGDHLAEIVNGSIVRVTPKLHFHDTITVTYQVSDGKMRATGMAFVTVQHVNHPPVTPGGKLDVRGSATIRLTAQDIDGDAVTYEVVTPPAHGALKGTPPDLEYVPAVDFSGDDELTYRASDGHAVSAPAVIQFHVTADAPPIAVTEAVPGSEDQPLALTLHGSDPDDTALQFTIETPPQHGTLTGTPPDLRYMPDHDFNGDDSLAFSVSDGFRSSDAATLTIHVAPVNDPPVAAPQTVNIMEDGGSVTITLSGSDVDGDPLSFRVPAGPFSGPFLGTLSGAQGATVTYTPRPDANGTDTFTFVVFDGTTASAPATVTIHITPGNDPPTARTLSINLNEDTTTAITLAGDDIDHDALSFAIVTPPAHGTFHGSPPNLQYTPSPDYNGPDSFTYTASDGPSTSAPATVSISIAPVNDAPVAVGSSATTAEDTPVTITLQASDVDSQDLRYVIRIPPSDGRIVQSGTGPDVTYIPALNATGTRTFTFFVCDGAPLCSNEATVTIQITPVNDPPIANDDFAATDPGVPVSFNVTANDVDPEGDPFQFDSVEDPPHGAIEVVGDHLVYTPDDGFEGIDVFGYTVVDSHGAASTGQIHVGVGQYPAGAPAETLVAIVADLGDRGNAPSISDDGRYIVFPSSSKLVGDDTNGAQDIYLYDRGTRTVSRVSVASDGSQANGSSLHARISASGRYIVFESVANNLVPGDTNGVADVFRHDRVTGETVRVSVATDGHQAGGASSDPTVSDDGSRIAFISAAFDLVANDANGAQDVFVRDMMAGTTTRVSVSITGNDADLRSQDPVISGDGLHVAFSSAATNVVPGDSNSVADVFVRDLVAGTTARASVSSTGGEANALSNSPALSRDGRIVSFVSAASNLVAPPATTNQLFVRDTQAPTTTRPTSSTNSVSWGRLSGDGRYLVEQALAGTLLVDRLAGVSVNLSGGNTWSWPVLSGNGRYVVVLDAKQGGSITVIPNPR